jgi:hypothetical protein
MARKIAPATIRDYGLEVANLDVPEERSAEIAPEVDALNSTVRDAAALLDLNDEPSQFALALVRNRQPRGKKR